MLLHRCVCLLAGLLAQSSQVQVKFKSSTVYLRGTWWVLFSTIWSREGEGEGEGCLWASYRFLRGPFFVPKFLDLCTVLSCPRFS